MPWVSAFPGGLGALLPVADATGVRWLASGGSDHSIRLWDLRTGATDGEPLIGHTTAVWALTSWVAADGSVRLASSAEDERICVWDVQDHRQAIAPLTGHAGWIATLVNWTGEDGRVRIASGGFDATIRIWDVETGTQIHSPLIGHEGPVLRLFHWRDESGVDRLASTGDDGTLRLWDAGTGQALGTPLAGASAAAWGLTGWTAEDGRTLLASAGTDGKIQVWDPVAGAAVGAPVDAHGGTIGAMTAWVDRDGPRIASLGADGMVRFWDPSTGAAAAPAVQGTSGWLPALVSWVDSDGAVQLACGGEGGGIRVWDFDSGADLVAPLVGHTSSMWALAAWQSNDGARLAAAGDDAAVRIWNADTGAAIGAPFLGHTAGIWALTAWIADDGAVRLASGADDATIRLWDAASGTPIGEGLTGHLGWIMALETFVREDGQTVLASAGIDGTVRLWDAESGVPLGSPLHADDGRVLALATARTGDGRRLIASGGTAQVVHIWDAESGDEVIAPMSGHTATVRSATGWTDPHGRARFATAGFDGTVRVWDPHEAACLHILTGHIGQVACVVSWTNAAGNVVLATGGDDSTVRVWDPESGTPMGEPLVGHTAGIWALAPFTTAAGRELVASTGEDGTIRLWDPFEGSSILTVEVGQLTLRGLSDLPTRLDALGRGPLVQALADQLLQPSSDTEAGLGVISVEGPWGSGKTTFMQAVRRRIAQPPPRPPHPAKPLTVREARKQIRAVAGNSAAAEAADQSAAPVPSTADGQSARSVTAWFNPWAYESSEQIWAGLAHEIIEASAGVLFPDDASRERYWFGRNARRVDTFALHRALMFRILSPVFGVAAIAVLAPIALGVAQLSGRSKVGGVTVTGTDVALAIAAAFVLMGVVHTLVRFQWSPVAQYVPAAMLHRPLVDGLSMVMPRGSQVLVPDPQHSARAGQLFLHQRDIGDLLTDLNSAGYQMVIFIDDIDRCRMATIVEVFEAINILLSGVISRDDVRARFVIGLDPALIAAQLGAAMGTVSASFAPDEDAAALGWMFLRKIIQLPVVLPRVSDAGIERFIDLVTSRPTQPSTRPPSPAAPAHGPLELRSAPPAAPNSNAESATSQSGPRPPVSVPRTLPGAAPATLAWRSLEGHPRVRAFLAARLKQQPHRSLRDTKRLMNVWQLYERVLTATHPEADAQRRITRAQNLLLLAEILTRWPRLQLSLNDLYPQGRGLEILAAAVRDERRWSEAVELVFGDVPIGPRDLAGLRSMLAEYDGEAVAALAAELM